VAGHILCVMWRRHLCGVRLRPWPPAPWRGFRRHI